MSSKITQSGLAKVVGSNCRVHSKDVSGELKRDDGGFYVEVQDKEPYRVESGDLLTIGASLVTTVA